MKIFAALFSCGLIFVTCPGARAQGNTKPNQVKGQGQLAGTYASFGTVYSLKNNFNFAILKAGYSVEPFGAQTARFTRTDEKLLVIEVAFKNVLKQDQFFDNERFMTVVDDAGQLYEESWYALNSSPTDTGSFTLKPGQGLGQTELKDPYRIAFLLPQKAKITKIIINKGRLGTNEEVVRYLIAKTAPEADAKNIISPLPATVADPSDPSGATALAVGKGTKGTYLPSGQFHLRLDDVKLSTATLGDMEPGEGRAFLIATVTAKLSVKAQASMFEVIGGDDPLWEVLDGDGERVKPMRILKASSNSDAEHEFKPGDEYKFRLVFDVPKEGKLKTLTLAAGFSRKWAFDLASLLP